MATIQGTEFSDVLDGTDEDDVIYGGDNEELGTGFDTLSGNGGNDTIYGDSDYMYGGVGDDLLVGDFHLFPGGGNDTVSGTFYATLHFSDYSDGVTVDIALTERQDLGAQGSITIAESHLRIGRLIGSDFGDVLLSANEIYGGAGNDTIGILTPGPFNNGQSFYGEDGNDIIRSSRDRTLLSGGAGNDTLIGSGDNLEGGSGNDFLMGKSGGSVAYYAHAKGGVRVDLGFVGRQDTGGDGIDALFHITRVQGSRYADLLIGTDGNDGINGGINADTIMPGEGSDGASGGGGLDMLSYENLSGPVQISMRDKRAIKTTGTDSVDKFLWIVGTSFDDTIAGSNQRSDTIQGGDGADVLTGGAKHDYFRYVRTTDSSSKLADRDIVGDFFPGYDTIDLYKIDAIRGGKNDTFEFRGEAEFTAAGQVRVVQSGKDTLLQVCVSNIEQPEMTIHLNNVTASSITADDFLF